MKPLVLASLLSGCATIAGLDGYKDGVDGGTEASADGGEDGMACGSFEVCDDGIDNDCNGKVDCADPACVMGWVCAPPLPNGWQRVAYDPDQRPNCSSGYASPLDVGEGLVAAPATCTCGCTTTAPSCSSGLLVITAGTTGMNGCQDKANQMESAAAGCHVLSAPINAGGSQKMNITGPTATGGNCTPTGPMKTTQPPAFMHDGRVCTGGGIGGGGCGGTQRCIPAPAPFEACVEQAGDATCPAGFPVKHLVGATVNDTRDCSACACTFTAGGCSGAITFDDDSACTTNPFVTTVDGICHVSTSHTWKSYKYTAQTNESCNGMGSMATGNATVTDSKTVCCSG